MRHSAEGAGFSNCDKVPRRSWTRWPKTIANSRFPFQAACSNLSGNLVRGKPEPLKMGSFCRTRTLSPSIAEMPVSMNSAGGMRDAGFAGTNDTR
jgi:hypothetical protein